VTKAAHFDPATMAAMKMALDDAWNRLEPELQATMLKTTLAERILKSASRGERDYERLRDAALRGTTSRARQSHFRFTAITSSAWIG
jgi:hypothetical protein